MTKTELFFVNPTSKTVTLSINNIKILLQAGCAKILDVSDKNEIDIISNCLYIRPLIFNYNTKIIISHKWGRR